MIADQAQIGVVPASAEVVTGLVVGGEHDPRRPWWPVGLLGEVDDHLLPVGFVVVDAVGAAAPVVEHVEVPVLQSDVAAAAHDPAVVGMVIGTHLLAVLRLRSGASTTRLSTPTRARRPAARNRGRPGRRLQMTCSVLPNGSDTNRRNCPAPVCRAPAAASPSRVTSPQSSSTFGRPLGTCSSNWHWAT